MPRSISRGAAGRSVIAVLTVAACLLALVLTSLSPAAASRVRVDKKLFGMHDATLDSLGSGVGSIRLWDTGVQWNQIASYNPLTGVPTYDWTRLDTLVDAAHRRHVEVTLVLGQTPSYFSATPATLPMEPTATGAPNPAVVAFQRYVAAVMQRYGTRIRAYQVWNEANIGSYWTGTQHDMARLTKIVYDVRNRWAPTALVVSAPMVTRMPLQQHWLAGFSLTRVDGTPVWRYVDALALNLYPLALYGHRPGAPEDSMALLAHARKVLARADWPASTPIWTTEINYGLRGTPQHAPTTAEPIPDAEQAANVIRTYVLSAADRVKRVFWYRWDMPASADGGTRGNTLLTRANDPDVITPAGRAFRLVQSWLHGTLVGVGRHSPCQVDRRGTYSCTVRYRHGSGRIYWNPRVRVWVTVPRSARTLQGELGRITRLRGGHTIRVGYRPVLVRCGPLRARGL